MRRLRLQDHRTEVEQGVRRSQAARTAESEDLAAVQKRCLQVLSVSMECFSYLSGRPTYLTLVL